MNVISKKLSGLIVCVIFLAFTAFSGQLTMSDFNKIKEGMTEAQVQKILGKPNQIFSGARKVGVRITRHAWMTDKGASITVIFHDGKVFSSSQFGLEKEKSDNRVEQTEKKKISLGGLWKNSSLSVRRSCILIVQDGNKLYVNGYGIYKKTKILWYGTGKRKDNDISLKIKYTSCPKKWMRTRVYDMTIQKDGNTLTGSWTNKKGEIQKVQWTRRIFKKKQKTVDKNKKQTRQEKQKQNKPAINKTGNVKKQPVPKRK